MDFKLKRIPELWRGKEAFMLLVWDIKLGWVRHEGLSLMYVDEATRAVLKEQAYAELTKTTTEDFQNDLRRLGTAMDPIYEVWAKGLSLIHI